MAHHHDALFKFVFSDVTHAEPALKHLLPAGLVASADWSTLTLCPGSFVDEALRERHSDLLFSVSIRGTQVLVYLLLEHQSSNDRWMPLRLLRYQVRIWDSHLAAHAGDKTLPIILPMVLHHSQEGWSCATSMDELYALDEAARALVSEHLVRFRFMLDDISHQDSETLRQKTLTSLGELALRCLRLSRDPETLTNEMKMCGELFREVLRAPNGAAGLIAVFRYIYAHADPKEAKAFLRQLEDVVNNPETKEVLMTVADYLEAKGRAEGRTEGRTEGRAEGQRTMLLRQLRARFGALPEATVEKVSRAGIEDLERWADRIFLGTTVDDVLA